ncbi:hypothetical protein SK128_019430, partial [Halocaridina rubra]
MSKVPEHRPFNLFGLRIGPSKSMTPEQGPSVQNLRPVFHSVVKTAPASHLNAPRSSLQF